jgi:hypothetical protein
MQSYSIADAIAKYNEVLGKANDEPVLLTILIKATVMSFLKLKLRLIHEYKELIKDLIILIKHGKKFKIYN